MDGKIDEKGGHPKIYGGIKLLSMFPKPGNALMVPWILQEQARERHGLFTKHSRTCHKADIRNFSVKVGMD